jgi:GNAT superfamily N-acetyltransferase
LQLCRRTDHVETWSPPYVNAHSSLHVDDRRCAHLLVSRRKASLARHPQRGLAAPRCERRDRRRLGARSTRQCRVSRRGGRYRRGLSSGRARARGAYDVGREALPDVPGGEEWTPPPFEQFAATHLRGVILLAVADGEVVGYAKLVPRPDGRSADHGMTAVKRNRRGAGIATSLKRAQIAWAKAQGFERLTASNEERNAAMRRINESLGYRPAPGRVRLRAPLGAV